MALWNKSVSGPSIIVTVSTGCSCTLLPLFAHSPTAHMWPVCWLTSGPAGGRRPAVFLHLAGQHRLPARSLCWPVELHPRSWKDANWGKLHEKKKDRRFVSGAYVQPLPVCLSSWEMCWCLRKWGSVTRLVTAVRLTWQRLFCSLLLLVTLQPRVSRNYCVSGRNNSTWKEEEQAWTIWSLQLVNTGEAAV